MFRLIYRYYPFKLLHVRPSANTNDISSILQSRSTPLTLRGLTTVRLHKNQPIQSPSIFTEKDIGKALYDLRNMRCDNPTVRERLAMLTRKIRQSPHPLNHISISMIFTGLQNMSSTYSEVRSILAVLGQKISQSTCELDAQAIGNALYGMKEMSSDCGEVIEVVGILAEKISQSTCELNSQNISNALYGLKGMDSECVEVRKMLSVLSVKISASKHVLSGQGVGNALNGLQNMSSANSEVRSILAVLGQKLLHSDAMLNGQAIGNALYGLNEMSSDSGEVIEVVGILADKISQSTCELNSQAIGNALYGMKSMSCRHDLVRNIISALTDKIATSKVQLEALSAGNAIYGLQMMSLDTLEVRSCVKTLFPSVQELFSRTASEYSPSNNNPVSMLLFGLCNLLQNSNSPFNNMVEVAEMIEEIRKYVHRSRSQISDSNEMRSLWQNAVLFQGKEGIPEKCVASLDGIVNDLHPMLRQLKCESVTHKHENAIASLIRHKLSENGRTWKVHTNVMLNGFEADIVVDFCDNYSVNDILPSKGLNLVNIELDGKAHLHATKKRFSKSRDVYVSTKLNIPVERKNRYDFKSNQLLASSCVDDLIRHFDKNVYNSR